MLILFFSVFIMFLQSLIELLLASFHRIRNAMNECRQAIITINLFFHSEASRSVMSAAALLTERW